MRSTTLVLLLAAFATCCFGQRNNRPRPHEVGPQWESLFDGKTLDGWIKVGEEKWVVENGEIYGEGITDAYGYLATEKEYANFQFSLRFKCEADGNSGVYVHTKFEPGTPRVIAGRQIEIDRTLNHHTGGVYGDGVGWVAWPAPEFETVIRPYDWNDMLIRVEGQRYVVVLNGIQILDFTYPAPVATQGQIALQLHSGGEGRMRFKDLFVKDLGGVE